ncbi:ethylene-responsive transcription factor ERF020-like [Cucurbita moschata]|uniref:Ethylene-responsive transcription factor ERF020-like n=1 Tax=Cucurbita moschata TaxID=3662 RepID=A0A6J1HG65_CUCMO|nr:ethylene-responsive transcription factor ERF020-like [Cucurbita moschata]
MASNSNTGPPETKKYKGVRRRKWGKWVSEIRVPGTQERMWLGSYSSPEAAAVAHDVAYYCLRRPSNLDHLNFPPMVLPLTNHLLIRDDMSPGSIQKAASDAAMAVDAQYICNSSPDRGSSGGTGAFHGSGYESYTAMNDQDRDRDISIEDYL